MSDSFVNDVLIEIVSFFEQTLLQVVDVADTAAINALLQFASDVTSSLGLYPDYNNSGERQQDESARPAATTAVKRNRVSVEFLARYVNKSSDIVTNGWQQLLV